MLDKLHQLPDLVILIAFVTLLAGVAFASPFIGRMMGLAANKGRDEAVFDAFKTVMAMAGVVLAFSLVQADSNLRSAQAIVGREAIAVQTLDRTLLRFGGDPAIGQYRPMLDAFGRSQLRDEWPTFATKGRSPETDARYTALSRAVRTIEPQSRREEAIYAEMIKAMDDISDERENLIQDTGAQLPGFFWVVSGSFVLLGLVLGGLAEASVTRATALSGTAAGIGLLLSFVLIVDQPFQGQTAVKATPLERVLMLNAHRR
jgi:hypothetical protein